MKSQVVCLLILAVLSCSLPVPSAFSREDSTATSDTIDIFLSDAEMFSIDNERKIQLSFFNRENHVIGFRTHVLFDTFCFSVKSVQAWGPLFIWVGHHLNIEEGINILVGQIDNPWGPYWTPMLPYSFLTVQIIVDTRNCPCGEYPWIVTNTVVSTMPGPTGPIRERGGIVTVQPVPRGDVNDDGIVNILDIVSATRIILGQIEEPTQEMLDAADCDEDGQVNILDLIGIVNLILGTGTCWP